MSYEIPKRQWKFSVGDVVTFNTEEAMALFYRQVWVITSRLWVYDHGGHADGMFAYGMQRRDDLDEKDARLVLPAGDVERCVEEWKPSASVANPGRGLRWDYLAGLEKQIEVLSAQLASQQVAHVKETFELRQGCARAKVLEERMAKIRAEAR